LKPDRTLISWIMLMKALLCNYNDIKSNSTVRVTRFI
jgi:hypothetical protein